MKPIRVIGVGSPFGQDNVAQHVVEALQQNARLTDLPQLAIQYHDRPGLYLVELMQGAAEVHIIDAVQSDDPPGTVYQIDDWQQLVGQTRFSSHDIGVAEALQLADSLQLLPPKLVIHGVAIGESGFDLDQACRALVEQVVACLLP